MNASRTFVLSVWSMIFISCLLSEEQIWHIHTATSWQCEALGIAMAGIATDSVLDRCLPAISQLNAAILHGRATRMHSTVRCVLNQNSIQVCLFKTHRMAKRVHDQQTLNMLVSRCFNYIWYCLMLNLSFWSHHPGLPDWPIFWWGRWVPEALSSLACLLWGAWAWGSSCSARRLTATAKTPGEQTWNSLRFHQPWLENGPFINDVPMKTSIYMGFSS